MPPRKKKPAAPAPEPFDLLELRRFLVPAALVVAVVLAGVWVYHMEGVAAHQRIVRQIAEHPTLGPWYRHEKTKVENRMHNPAGGAAPVALWYGLVKRTIVSQPLAADSGPRLKAVDLTDTDLLAGQPGHRDSESSVVIGVFGHAFPGPEPAEGERWLFSVSRNPDGNSFSHQSARVDP
ncbi:hypothetical protein BH23VER1_BH23VER1_14110 [soil metagenome]